MGKSDGKVVISTALDNKGLEKGIKSISGSFGGLKRVVAGVGTAIAAAFSIKAIVDFGAESSKAAMQLTDALIGLKSILDGQGRSFSGAKAFLEEYTKDGLIPMTNAVAAYKNLAMRGYSDEQIQQTLIALKDASAYGRQASYTMGEAVQGTTEGLKNENSILVDNAGITKNVAKMWDEYAQSIGTTSNNLTKEQKIQAEVNGILEESKYQTGDAAKVAGTLSGQLQQLAFNFNNLKVAVGNVINPIVKSFLPVINSAIATVTQFANTVAQAVSALFGDAGTNGAEVTKSISTNYESAANGAEELENSTKAASKAAKQLAGFDEISKIGAPTGSSSNTATSEATGSTSIPVIADTEVEDAISPKIQKVVDKIKELLEPLKNINLEPAVAALGRFRDAVAPLTSKLFEGLEWAWNNLLVPLAAWTIEDFIPAFLDSMSAGLGVLNSTAEALKPLAEWLWNEFLQPMAEWTGGVIVDTLNNFAKALQAVSDWINDNKEVVETMTITIGGFAAAWTLTDIAAWIINAGGIVSVLKNIATAVYSATAAKLADKAVDVALIALYAWDYIKAFGGVIAKLATSTTTWAANTAAKVASTAAEWAQIAATTAWNAICTVATTLTTAFGAAMAFLTSPIGLVVVAVAALIAIIVLLVKNWDTVKAAALKVWEAIKSAFGSAWKWFKGTVLDPLVNGFKGMVNGIIGFLNGLIAGVVKGINSVIGLLNKLKFDVPDWIPGIGGQTFGFNLKLLNAPQIPYLAQGAVLPANKPFMAVVGDQKHGTNVEAPLETIKQALAEVLTMQGSGDVTINFTGDLAQLGRVLKPVIERESRRTGTSLAKGALI